MVLSHFCCQSCDYLLLGSFHTGMHEFGQADRIILSCTQSLQYSLPGEAQNIAERHRQLAPSCVEHFMDAIDQTSSLLDQADAQPSEVSQILLLLTGNKTGGE